MKFREYNALFLIIAVLVINSIIEYIASFLTNYHTLFYFLDSILPWVTIVLALIMSRNYIEILDEKVIIHRWFKNKEFGNQETKCTEEKNRYILEFNNGDRAIYYKRFWGLSFMIDLTVALVFKKEIDNLLIIEKMKGEYTHEIPE